MVTNKLAQGGTIDAVPEHLKGQPPAVMYVKDRLNTSRWYGYRFEH